jgi:hypothetical protein
MRALHRPSSRRSPRHATNIVCQVVRLSDFRLVADRISDISPQGMLVNPADPVLTGEPILVSFRVPNWGRWVDAEGTVARVVHGRRPGDGPRCLGIELGLLSDKQRFVLDQAMRWMPVAPPRWRPDRRSMRSALHRLIRGSGGVALGITARNLGAVGSRFEAQSSSN